jgi:hypothetical protein
MPILNVHKVEVGVAGVQPGTAMVLTDDTIAEITTAGYLNGIQQGGAALSDVTCCLVSTKTSPSASSSQIGWYDVSYDTSTKNWSLSPLGEPGSVTLPTVASHLAVFSNATGALVSDASDAINSGNIQAGLSGTAGVLKSYPSTSAKGFLELAAVANTGDTSVILSNAAHGQASVYSIPDCADAVGRVLVGATATPFTTSHLLASSGTGGLVGDSGIATSAVQLSANIKAATTGNIGGAGAGPITVTVAGLTAASVVVATIEASSNAVSVVKATAGSGNFDVTFSADPGASCTLNYVAFIAAQ